MIADARHAAVGRNDTVFASQNQCFVLCFNQAIAGRVIYSVSDVHCDDLKACTTVERLLADARDTRRNRDACQAMAIPERISADARHAVTDRDARKSRAIVERIITNARHAVGNNEFRN